LTLWQQTYEMARRSVLQTLRQPAMVIPPVLFPLVLMGINVSGGGSIASLGMGAVTPATPVPMAALICLCGFAAVAANYFWSAPVLEPAAPNR